MAAKEKITHAKIIFLKTVICIKKGGGMTIDTCNQTTSKRSGNIFTDQMLRSQFDFSKQGMLMES